jgi:hypothetical protein
VTITAAASKYSGGAPDSLMNDAGRTSGATVATIENSQAAPVPSAISVNMLRLRVTTECQPRTKNGQPAQSTTGVASTSWAHATAACGKNRIGLIAGKSSPSIDQSSGTVSTTPIQKRRVISMSSWFSPSSAVGASGSSAIPQIGQAPGASRRISGCIGHVQTVAPAADVAATDDGATLSPSSAARYFAGSAAKRSRHRALQK